MKTKALVLLFSLLIATSISAAELTVYAAAIVFAIEQPADVDVNEIIVRPTAQD